MVDGLEGRTNSKDLDGLEGRTKSEDLREGRGKRGERAQEGG
jgi:hypothetical protein